MTASGPNTDFVPADGALAPPCVNGELVFEAPWQGRAFGMARAMVEAGVFEWDEFRACLIDELAGRESSADAPFPYWEHFLRALETLLATRNLVSTGALAERCEAFMSRAHGHDHLHQHP